MGIIEKASRCERFEDDYIGPWGIAAEMEIEVNGELQFVYSVWIAEVDDCLDYFVARESIFDILTCKAELDEDVEFESYIITNERDEAYAEQFDKLEQLLRAKAAEEGIDYGYFSDCDDEDMYKMMTDFAEACRYVIFIESEAHGIHDCPCPCSSEEEALNAAEARYKQEMDFGKVTKCQVCEAEVYVSENAGFVYSVKRVIKDFADKDC